MPHPLVFRKASLTQPAQLKASGYLAGLQRPFVPERQMTVNGGYVQRLLREWASPEGIWPSPQEATLYAEAMALPFVAHSAAEYYRWVVRSQLRPDGWRFAASMRTPITVPVLQLHGAHDPVVLPRTAVEPVEAVSRPVRAPPRARRGALPARGGAGRGHGAPARLARRPAGLISRRRRNRC